MSQTSPTETTLNIPQLAILLVISFLAVRWILSPRSDSTSQSSSSSSSRRGAGVRADPRHVDTVQQLFPQLSRREIMWDLQRNGNNVQMTTERMLTGRGLDQPPQSFQPQLPPSTASATATPARSSTPSKALTPDLIQRYNLSTRLSEPSDSTPSTPVNGGAQAAANPGWSNSKSERQSALQKKREEMILAARRKMQAAEKGKGVAS